MILKFETKGTPYERGLQQGMVCASIAEPWFRVALDNVRRRVDPAVVLREESVWRKRMESVYPDGHEESCGIAAGMGMSEDDYFAAAVSFRLLNKFASCTAAGFHTVDGRPMFIKTDDVQEGDLGLNVLETTIPSSGYRHIHFHCAGSIWTVAGMNECGLAMGMTGIPGPSLEEDGLFTLDALHSILPACATVEEAQEHIKNLKINYYGFSLTLADSDGKLSQIEKSGVGTVILPLSPDGFFLHTNTILDLKFAAKNPQQSAELRLSSDQRIQNVAGLLKKLPRTEETLREIMCNRSSEGAICQKGEAGLFTDFAALFSPVEKRMYYRAGCPDYAETGTLLCSELFR